MDVGGIKKKGCNFLGCSTMRTRGLAVAAAALLLLAVVRWWCWWWWYRSHRTGRIPSTMKRERGSAAAAAGRSTGTADGSVSKAAAAWVLGCLVG